MRVTVLGTRGNIKPTAPRHSRHSGVLVDGTVMLDLGEPGFLRYSPKYVLLTHLHPDHAVQARTTAGTTVYAPEGSGLT
ncbi:MAG: hypothetical protein HYX90_03560, partial [Chloroflexi bacterium]|nr:hypothetical protein [Chloroflexota bacterium]